MRILVEGNLPVYGTYGSAGADLSADIEEPVVLSPGAVAVIRTGVRIAIPPSFEGQVRSRSGLAAKHRLFVLNAPGTIDSDYRGDIGVVLANFGDAAFTVEPGMRIAQLVITPVVRPEFVSVPRLPDSERGDGGFGSTGL